VQTHNFRKEQGSYPGGIKSLGTREKVSHFGESVNNHTNRVMPPYGLLLFSCFRGLQVVFFFFFFLVSYVFKV
jgi:hypothetical protein